MLVFSSAATLQQETNIYYVSLPGFDCNVEASFQASRLVGGEICALLRNKLREAIVHVCGMVSSFSQQECDELLRVFFAMVESITKCCAAHWLLGSCCMTFIGLRSSVMTSMM